MATIETYSLGGGAKRYRVRYRTPENKSTDKSGFTTKRDAQAFASTVEVSKMSGTYIAPAAGRVTVGEVARQWLVSSSATVKATTMAKHQSAWTFRVQPRWGSVAIGDVRPPAIRAWVAELHASGVGAASIESALGVLRGVLESALDDRALIVNPAAGVKPPRRKLSKRGYLTIPQVEAIAVEAMAVRPMYATVIGFLAYTGIRWGEMARPTGGELSTCCGVGCRSPKPLQRSEGVLCGERRRITSGAPFRSRSFWLRRSLS
jgi:hypothetical protein